MEKERCPFCGTIQIIDGVCPNCGTNVSKKIKKIETPHKPALEPDSLGGNQDNKRIDYDSGKNEIFSGNMMHKRIINETSQ
ncbi:hypothetical protein KAU09_04065 [Candidatus Parcubacteria bacterium]|nr:hypothetical protein [Candidatus Parcubacteria bacterium]